MFGRRAVVPISGVLVSAALVFGCGEAETEPGSDAGVFRDSGTFTNDGGPTSPTLTAEMAALLDVMNEARAEVGSPPLSWNEAVADTAAGWAAQCNWGHAPQHERIFGQDVLGENLSAGSGNIWTPARLGQGWNDEKAFFDCVRNECQANEMCGHYTQVIWRSSTQVGCAFQACQSGSPLGAGAWQFLVCRYLPAGNFVGERPVPASDCP